MKRTYFISLFILVLLFSLPLNAQDTESENPEDVIREARKCMEIGMPGSGFLLSAGCEVHHCCKPENILALTQAARDYGSYS